MRTTNPKSIAWIARTPKGRYALLVPQPGLAGWWKQIEDFATAQEATAYARKAAIEVEKDCFPPPRTFHTSRTEWRVGHKNRSIPRINGILLTPMRAKIFQILHDMASPHNIIALSNRRMGALLGKKEKPNAKAIASLIEMGLMRKITMGTATSQYEILDTADCKRALQIAEHTAEQREVMATDLAESPSGNTPAAHRSDPHTLGVAILGKLDELYKLNPGGVPVQTIIRDFDTNYHSALEACRWLGATKRAQWGYRGGTGQQRKFLYPLGTKPPRQELSALQDKILIALVAHAKDGVVRMGYRDIGRAAGVNKNSVSQALDGLRTKGYIRLVDKGGSAGRNLPGGAPSAYAISREPTQENKDAAVGSRA